MQPQPPNTPTSVPSRDRDAKADECVAEGGHHRLLLQVVNLAFRKFPVVPKTLNLAFKNNLVVSGVGFLEV